MKNILLVILIVFCAFVVSCNKKQQTETNNADQNNSLSQQQPSDNEVRLKELEIRERELKIKEQELANNRTQNSTGNNIPGLYPQTSIRKLDRMDVESLAPSKHDKKIMRNEIYARHGYIFQTEDMRNYFNNQSWYTPRYSDVSSMLTAIEKYNIELIKYAETGAE
jgi:hypothetical protein